MRTSFRDRLNDSRPIIFDGGMGTELVARGKEPGPGTSVSIPETILEIHRAYRAAGAEVIIANTFSANRIALDAHQASDKLSVYISASCRLAREAAGDDGWVAGNIGPTGDFLEPVGLRTPDAMQVVFQEAAGHLADGGVDLFVIETMSDLNELKLAVKACRDVASHLPVIASMSFDPVKDGFRTNMGFSPTIVARELAEAEVDVIGANCGSTSPEQMADIVVQFKNGANKPVLIEANAGLPQLSYGRTVYVLPPEDFAAGMLKVVQAGANAVGGCCGTTPAHIKALKQALASSTK